MHVTRSFCAEIYPPLLDTCRALVRACEARGVTYWATSGLRTHAEQDALYALGRTSANVDATPARPLGSVVTKARAGQSWHNFGLAVDFAADAAARDGLQPDWRSTAYAVLGEEAQRLGLEWGGKWKSFKDYPHVQWPGVSLASLQAEYARGGVPAVWRWVDALP